MKNERFADGACIVVESKPFQARQFISLVCHGVLLTTAPETGATVLAARWFQELHQALAIVKYRSATFANSLAGTGATGAGGITTAGSIPSAFTGSLPQNTRVNPQLDLTADDAKNVVANQLRQNFRSSWPCRSDSAQRPPASP